MNKLFDPGRGKMRVLGYSSGSGNSLWKALELQKRLEGAFAGCPFEIVGVFSDNPESAAVQKARENGLDWAALDLKKFYAERGRPLTDMETRRAYDAEAYQLIRKFNADLIILAGYVWAVTEIIVDNYLVVNTHPADLSVERNGCRPFAGADGVGATLRDQAPTICSSAHLATSQVDGGPLLFTSPDIPIDYGKFTGTGDFMEMRKFYLRAVNEHSRLLTAKSLYDLSMGFFAVDGTGALHHQGVPAPLGVKINSFAENVPLYERDTAKLLRPDGIAVIGASAKGGIGWTVLNNIKESGFRGQLCAVNRNGDEVLGVAGYKSVLEAAFTPDLAVLTVPGAGVPEVAEQCGQKGVKALVCISAGFKETGPAGMKREKELMGIVNKYNLRLVGPNCMGFLNNSDPQYRYAGTILKDAPPPGGVAFVTQSGALGAALVDHAPFMHLGLSSLISTGNQADINVNDLLPLLAEDDHTKSILLYLEQIVEPAFFARLAAKTAARKPIVLIKSGRSSAGALAASSHTGSLAGSDAALGALLAKSGVTRVNTVEEGYLTAQALSLMPKVRGNRVGILTNAGGPGILATDSLAECGFTFPQLPDELKAELAPRLLKEATVSNPIDVVATALPEHYQAALETMLKSGQYDALLLICVPPATVDTAGVAEACLPALKSSGLPALTCFMGPTLGGKAKRVLLENGIPCLDFPEQLATLLRNMREKKVYAPARPPDPPLAPCGLLARHAGKRLLRNYPAGRYLSAPAAFKLLGWYGIGLPGYALAASAAEAKEAARGLRFPLAAKIEHSAVVHKSDAGGVILNIKDAAQLESAVAALLEKFPGAAGVLTQEMRPLRSEVILGGKKEPGQGHVLLLGAGGTGVEIYKDVALAALPLAEGEETRLLESLRLYPLLKGYRGAAGVNLSKLEAEARKLGQLLLDLPQITEIDLNPITFDVEADAFTALDCRIRL
ncbi:MAG: acetate--CoA ligase family protein [Deltaproteobacteria bacterium]|jgi:acetyltransferase|nr:acetate--CoA ligase family protein [Deltaproteobacteria bacterium]